MGLAGLTGALRSIFYRSNHFFFLSGAATLIPVLNGWVGLPYLVAGAISAGLLAAALLVRRLIDRPPAEAAGEAP